MRIYRWKKPTVVITKGSSGTFSPGTYYVWGYYAYGPLYTPYSLYYGYATSPRPDVQTVVLGAGETSITVSLQCSGAITSITDAGSGKITVVSALHCLTSGDAITITGTTNYNGTYTITDWVDYNTFKVTATYVSDETTGTWTNSTVCNGASYILAYIHNAYPFNSNNDYIPTTGNNHMYRSALNTNSITMTSYSYSYTGYVTGAADCDILSLDARWIIDYGVPILYGTDVTVSDASFQTEFLNAGLSSICEIRTSTGTTPGTHWYIPININMTSLVKSVSDGVIRLGAFSDIRNVTFTLCTIEKIGYGYKDGYNNGINAGWRFNMTNCSIHKLRNTSNYTESIVSGGGNSIYGGLLMSNCNYLGSAAVSFWGAHDNIGKTRTIENITLSKEITGYGFDNVVTAFKNVTFTQATYNYDFYLDKTNTALTSCNCINIDNTRTNNEKKCYEPYTHRTGFTFNFYRQKDIYVYDVNGDPIDGATITISQGATDYTATTDANGKATTPVMLEQVATIADYTRDIYTNTMYYDFTLVVSKTGYETYSSLSEIPKNIEENITLKAVKKIRLTIDGNFLIANQPELGSSSNLLKI